MECLTYAKLKYYGQRNYNEVLLHAQQKLGNHITAISNEMFCIFFDAINTEPIYYFNKDVYKNTFFELENLYKSNLHIKISEEMLEHFFVGYSAYRNITTIINDLGKANYSQELKN